MALTLRMESERFESPILKYAGGSKGKGMNLCSAGTAPVSRSGLAAVPEVQMRRDDPMSPTDGQSSTVCA